MSGRRIFRLKAARLRAAGSALALGLGSVGLSGCATDPAFWDNLNYALDTLNYELANQPVCSWVPNGYGGVVQHCVPAYALNEPVYVANPVYVTPDRHRGDRYRDKDRRGRDRDDRPRDRPRRDRDDR